MRLLHTTTFELRDFVGEAPKYAILSHTWGPAEDEVSYHDLISGKWTSVDNAGAAKIRGFCALASKNGYEWGWVDTCCIDKTSSTELSESINSMYRWYLDSHICYALLPDAKEKSDLRSSRWFKRGWTLQELLAPEEVEFYDGEWKEICIRSEAAKEISRFTGIAVEVLVDRKPLARFSAATRMSWAANRATTRGEDMAYCLLGIFGVNMPLLYGEGSKAFQRLQEEILKTTEDYTLLAWADTSLNKRGVLADSPRDFRNGSSSRLSSWSYNNIRVIRASDAQNPGPPSSKELLPIDEMVLSDTDFAPPQLTARGLRLRLPIIEQYLPRDITMDVQKVFLLFLNCYHQPDKTAVCIRLYPSNKSITIRNENSTLPPTIHHIAYKLRGLADRRQYRALMRLDSGQEVHCVMKNRPRRWLDMQVQQPVEQRAQDPRRTSKVKERHWPRLNDASELFTLQLWIEPVSSEPVTLYLWDESGQKWSNLPIEKSVSRTLRSEATDIVAPWANGRIVEKSTPTVRKMDNIDTAKTIRRV
ncbi:hypothetical protein CHU98_g10343 [Xylaria longipes]|nr:hypothetical protein CHU98_g10343 [Xylaria longipes]